MYVKGGAVGWSLVPAVLTFGSCVDIFPHLFLSFIIYFDIEKFLQFYLIQISSFYFMLSSAFMPKNIFPFLKLK